MAWLDTCILESTVAVLITTTDTQKGTFLSYTHYTVVSSSPIQLSGVFLFQFLKHTQLKHLRISHTVRCYPALCELGEETVRMLTNVSMVSVLEEQCKILFQEFLHLKVKWRTFNLLHVSAGLPIHITMLKQLKREAT